MLVVLVLGWPLARTTLAGSMSRVPHLGGVLWSLQKSSADRLGFFIGLSTDLTEKPVLSLSGSFHFGLSGSTGIPRWGRRHYGGGGGGYNNKGSCSLAAAAAAARRRLWRSKGS